jgi:hypothetical protein
MRTKRRTILSMPQRIVVAGMFGGPYAAAATLAAEQLNYRFFNTADAAIQRMLSDDVPPRPVQVYRKELSLLEAGWKRYGNEPTIAALRAEALGNQDIARRIKALGGMSIYVNVPDNTLYREYIERIRDPYTYKIAERSYAIVTSTKQAASAQADHSLGLAHEDFSVMSIAARIRGCITTL